MIDEILKKYGIDWNDLDTSGKFSGEKEQLLKMAESARSNTLTLEGVRSRITSMREGVEEELSKTDSNFFTWFLGWKKDYSLKARLRTYLLIEGILSNPDKVKQSMEEMVANMTRMGIK